VGKRGRGGIGGPREGMIALVGFQKQIKVPKSEETPWGRKK